MSDARTRWILELVDMVTGPAKNVTASVSGTAKEIRNVNAGLNVTKVNSAAAVSGLKSNFSTVPNFFSRQYSNLKAQTSVAYNNIKATGISAFTSIKNSGKQMVDELSAYFPLLGNAMRFITSPTGLIAGGILLTTGLMGKGISTAKEYNSQFLELEQLNLDKTAAQIDMLNNKVLDTAFVVGKSGKETAKAYFDIQSATGKYGEEVDSIVTKIGKFAKATKTDFDAAINGAAKSINAFNLNAEDMDAYLASSFKTVQVGVTTFDELAKVQTDYAGAAAAAGQDFNNANKLFAAFTTSAKSVNEAATLTKTAFQDLTKKSTIDGFKNIGVEIFDTNGKMRELDAIVRDAVPVLSKLNDQDFAELKEAIGGSEGIRALLDKMKGSGDAMIASFNQFDSTDFMLDKALENAENKLSVVSDILSNRINVGFIKLGNKLAPDVVEVFKSINNTIETIYNNWDEIYNVGLDILTIVGSLGIAWVALNAKIILTTGLYYAAAAGVMAIEGAMWLLSAAWNAGPGLIVTGLGLIIAGFAIAYRRSETFRAALAGMGAFVSTLIDQFIALGKIIVGTLTLNPSMLAEGREQWKNLKAEVASKGGYGGVYNAARDESLAQSKADKKQKEAETKTDPYTGIKTTETDSEKTQTNNQTSTSESNLSGSGSGGSGGGRSITMTLDIKNYFNVDSEFDIERIADQVVGRINDRLRDATIALG